MTDILPAKHKTSQARCQPNSGQTHIYDSHFAPLTNSLPIHRHTLRRFASIALRKSATGETWQTATTHYMDRHLKNLHIAPAVMNRIATNQGEHALTIILQSIAEMAMILQDDPRTGTYAATRAHANEVYSRLVSEATYRAHFPNSQPTEARRKWAAVKTWTEITSDNQKNAPMWGPSGPTGNDQESYWRWEKQQQS